VRLHHVALRVADCEASLAFYSGLLGLPETRRKLAGDRVESVWLRADETILMLERRLRGHGSDDDGGTGHLLALAVEDLPEWERRLTQAGVAIEDRTMHTLYLRDPDGHRVGLTTYSEVR
jgi:glyoxylase I family protein